MDLGKFLAVRVRVTVRVRVRVRTWEYSGS